MPRFTCTGHRAINCDDITEAARMFATRLARQKYGRRGYCRTLRHDSRSVPGASDQFAVYEVFIGRSVRGDRNTTTGHNEWLTVHVA